jgi:hypothetical protein
MAGCVGDGQSRLGARGLKHNLNVDPVNQACRQILLALLEKTILACRRLPPLTLGESFTQN